MIGGEIHLPRLIGLVGVSGSGKDVVAQILGASWGYRRLAIADPIKEATAVIFNLDREQLWGSLRDTLVDRIGMTPRGAFQQVGDRMRRVDPNFWVNLFGREVENTLRRGYRVVCPDVRTRTEFDAVRTLGGRLWHLSRPGAGAPGGAGRHETETQLTALPAERFDAVLVNDSDRVTLVHLCEAALRISVPGASARRGGEPLTAAGKSSRRGDL